VISALETTVENVLAENLEEGVTVESVNITSVNGIDVSDSSVSAGRRLTQGEVLWQVTMQAVKNVTTVTNDGIIVGAVVNGVEQSLNSIASTSNNAVVYAVAGEDTTADLFLASVAQAMDNAIAPSTTGEKSFMATFQAEVDALVAASGDAALSVTLTELADNIVILSVATDQTQDINTIQQVDVSPPVIETIMVLASSTDWYPDWGGSNVCLNDDNAPFYMKRNGYTKLSLEACCKRYFSWDFSTCTVGSVTLPSGFYPNWGGFETKCLNSTKATTTLPDYMQKNPQQWLVDDVESCCKEHYNWVYNDCISLSGANSAATATLKWYVNYDEEICQQDCPSEGGEPCGGLAKQWNVLYETPASCCAKGLFWIASPVCEDQSTDTAVASTSLWYVNWVLEKCVKDCYVSSDANCGGLAKRWDDKFVSASECCEKMPYVGRSDCSNE